MSKMLDRVRWWVTKGIDYHLSTGDGEVILTQTDGEKILALYEAATEDICNRGGHQKDCTCHLCVALRAIEEDS